MVNMMRRASRVVACAVLLSGPFVHQSRAADEYPARPVTLVIAAAPGGGTDIIGRIIGAQLSEQIRQPVVMVNKPGGASVAGAEYVARQKADGYTLLLTFDGHIISAALGGKRDYDPIASFTPISQVASTEIVLTVRSDAPAKDMKSFLAWAKAYKGNLNAGVPAPNSPFAAAASAFIDRAGLKAEMVNYTGSAKTILSLLGGETAFAITSLSTALPLIKDGSIRAIGVASLKASQALPDVAPIADTFPDYQFQVWFGILAPAGLPEPIRDRLVMELRKAVNVPQVATIITKGGSVPIGNSPEEFKGMLERDLQNWTRIAQTKPH